MILRASYILHQLQFYITFFALLKRPLQHNLYGKTNKKLPDRTLHRIAVAANRRPDSGFSCRLRMSSSMASSRSTVPSRRRRHLRKERKPKKKKTKENLRQTCAQVCCRIIKRCALSLLLSSKELRLTNYWWWWWCRRIRGLYRHVATWICTLRVSRFHGSATPPAKCCKFWRERASYEC